MYKPKMKLGKGLKGLGKTLGAGIKRLMKYNPGIETSMHACSTVPVGPYNQTAFNPSYSERTAAAILLASNRYKRELR